GYVCCVPPRRPRPPPSGAPPPPERYHGEGELPDPDEKLPLPAPLDLFNTRGEGIGEPGVARFGESDRYRARVAVNAIALTAVVVGVAGWLVATYVLPWLVPWVTGHARPLLAGGGAPGGAGGPQRHR